jgi:hypothetical protein
MVVKVSEQTLQQKHSAAMYPRRRHNEGDKPAKTPYPGISQNSSTENSHIWVIKIVRRHNARKKKHLAIACNCVPNRYPTDSDCFKRNRDANLRNQVSISTMTLQQSDIHHLPHSHKVPSCHIRLRLLTADRKVVLMCGPLHQRTQVRPIFLQKHKLGRRTPSAWRL